MSLEAAINRLAAAIEATLAANVGAIVSSNPGLDAALDRSVPSGVITSAAPAPAPTRKRRTKAEMEADAAAAAAGPTAGQSVTLDSGKVIENVRTTPVEQSEIDAAAAATAGNAATSSAPAAASTPAAAPAQTPSAPATGAVDAQAEYAKLRDEFIAAAKNPLVGREKCNALIVAQGAKTLPDLALDKYPAVRAALAALLNPAPAAAAAPAAAEDLF